MDSGAEFLYEALPPLDFAAGDPDPAEVASDSYAVFRNTITSSAGASAEIPVADYFSLDVSAIESPSFEATGAAAAPFVEARIPNGNHAAESAWFRARRRLKSPMLELHKEILDFCEFISPTPEEQVLRAAAAARVFDVIKYIWPHSNVEVFGSFRTGLYLPTSDIDVVILDSRVKTPQTGLYGLSRALSQRSIARNIQVIAKARVPIIKFVEKQSGIAFDISFDVDSGPKSADFIKDAVNKLPPLRPLCMLLKVFLQQRELNEVYSGGIGSYALLAMLIAFLQMHRRAQVFEGHQRPTEHNLGILLVNFFDFYGRKLNVADVGVSCNLRGTVFLKSERGFLNKDRPYLLSVEDPQAPDNDIGKNSFNFYKVKSAFAMAYSSLTDVKPIMALDAQRSILGTIIRPDSVLLDRKGGRLGELTFSSLLPGAGEPVLQLFGGEDDILYNWQFLDDEPLPREKTPLEDEHKSSHSKKSSKSEHKSARREDLDSPESRENGVGSEKKLKKQKKRLRDGRLGQSLLYSSCSR